MVAVKSDDDVPLRLRQAGLVSPPVTANLLVDDVRPKTQSHLCRAVRRIIVDDDDLIHEGRHARQNLDDALFFVETRYDHGDAAVVVHEA
jgi:hypothetical protein